MTAHRRRLRADLQRFLLTASAVTMLAGCGTSDVSTELLRFAEDFLRQAATAWLF